MRWRRGEKGDQGGDRKGSEEEGGRKREGAEGWGKERCRNERENTAVFQEKEEQHGDKREKKRESREPVEKVVMFQEGTWACEVSLVGS